eukprot:359602-Chlamydomonas_euryale.AAC.3
MHSRDTLFLRLLSIPRNQLAMRSRPSHRWHHLIGDGLHAVGQWRAARHACRGCCAESMPEMTSAPTPHHPLMQPTRQGV